MWKYLILIPLLAVTLDGPRAEAQPVATVGDVRLTVQTRNHQTVFRVGELITLQIAYSLTPGSPNSYVISNRSYDRSGRLGIETYRVEPTTGWDDPLKSYFQSFGGFLGGGLFSQAKLTTTPVVISRDLNEWVRFNVPGRYRLSVTSTRVQRADHVMGDLSLEVRSNEISLTIIPATPEWQKAMLDEAVGTLGPQLLPRANTGVAQVHEEPQQAIAILRYLGTPAAAEEMASRLNDETSAPQFMLGLASTPAREAALKRMGQLLHEPVFPVNETFLQTLSLLALSPHIVSGRAKQRAKLQEKFERELLETLASKQGNALAVSAYTIVNEAGMSSRQLPPGEKRLLTSQLVAVFDSLPVAAQVSLLEYRWQTLDKEAMRPLLPKIAERYTDFPNLREMNAYQANQLSAAALRHWWEVDPSQARPAVIREIIRPKPRFGQEVLGLLPDKTLPEVEQQLADHLTHETGNEEQIASLIFRYATAFVGPQIADYLDQRVGKLACAIQTQLLAYLLQVDPAGAAPLVERAMRARGREFSACNHSLLVEVATLHNDPILQGFAIASLNDSDPQIAENAATYLGTYGTAAAEAPLWARLAAWNSQWKGRGSELRYVPGESMDGTYQAGLGSNLISALATGQAWLTSKESLTRLIELSVTPEQRNHVKQLIDSWERQPRTIEFIPFSKVQFQIAQYHPLSIEAAIEKLKQFPAGSHFAWTGDLKREGEERAFEKMREAVEPNGITIRLASQR